VVEVRVVASVEERGRKDQEKYAEDRAAYRDRHRRPSDRAPTTVEMDARRASRRADGEIRELKTAPEVDPELVEALRVFLKRNPHCRGEYPSWLATAVWAEDLVPGKRPPPESVELALAELAAAA
jgi:hypothetical protein